MILRIIERLSSDDVAECCEFAISILRGFGVIKPGFGMNDELISQQLYFRKYRLLLVISVFVMLLLSRVSLSAQIDKSQRPPVDFNNIANVGICRLTMSNDGTLGNGFANISFPDKPGFEFPTGSRTDHLPDAAFWVGALDDDGSVLVSTANAFGGKTALINNEFAPTFDPADTVSFRSNLITNSRFFSPDAVSEQDLIAEFNDTTFIPVSVGKNKHVPLGLGVRLEVYNNSLPSVSQIKFLTYEITNINVNERTLRDVYVGFMIDSVVTSFAVTGGSFIPGDDVNGYVDSVFTAYEFDADGDFGLATTYIGVAALGATFPNSAENLILPIPESSGFPQLDVFFTFYGFGTSESFGNPQPDDDRERYERLSTSFNGISGSFETNDRGQEENGGDIGGRTGNRLMTLSVGPFTTLARGESIRVFFAIVGGFSRQDMVRQVERAREVFESNFALPSAPPSPNLSAVPGDGQVTLLWGDAPLSIPDPFTNIKDFEGFRVYRSPTSLPGDFVLIEQFDLVNDHGLDFGLPQRNSEGLFEFSDAGVPNGFELFYAVTSFDRGDSAIPQLESGISQNMISTFPGSSPNVDLVKKVKVVPNPYRGRSLFDGINERDKRINFTNLPARSTLRIYTLTGDLIETIRHQSNYVGDEPWDLITSEDQGIAAGIYVYVVTDEDTGKSQTGKFVVQK